MNSNERDGRLKQVREARRSFYGGMGQVTKDIDFLLSLLDSHATECNAADWAIEHVQSEYLRGRSDAATQMRDKCADAIKSLRAVPRGAAYNNAVNDALHKIASLTLEGD